MGWKRSGAYAGDLRWNTHPWSIPFQHDATGLTEYTFTVKLSDLSIPDITKACNSLLYVVTHAEVKKVKDANGNIGDETAFGGDQPGTGPRWWFYSKYYICCGDGTPVLGDCKTAFAKGGYVFTTDPKSNPEGLKSLNLSKNRWGWAIKLVGTGTTTYDLWRGAGLNKTSNGKKVGVLTVDWNGKSVKVTYTLNSGFVMQEAHVYAGYAQPTTAAPGQYGHTAYFDPEVGSYTFTIDTPANGAPYTNLWIIAHAVVCTLIKA